MRRERRRGRGDLIVVSDKEELLVGCIERGKIFIGLEKVEKRGKGVRGGKVESYNETPGHPSLPHLPPQVL